MRLDFYRTLISVYVLSAILVIIFCFISPEHPSFRARGRSMLSGDRKSFRDYADDIAASRFLLLLILNFLFMSLISIHVMIIKKCMIVNVFTLTSPCKLIDNMQAHLHGPPHNNQHLVNSG